MNECDILIQKGYKYIKFNTRDEFKIYQHIVIGFWIGEDGYEDGYYVIRDSKYSQWNADDGKGKIIDASQIEEELKLNLDWVLKTMESIDE